jgi:DNA repair protein RadC
MIPPPAEDDGALDRIERGGVTLASSVQLLSVALSGTAGDVPRSEGVALALLKRHGLHRLVALARADLEEQAGLTSFDALRCLAALELGRRAAIAGRGEVHTINDARDVFHLFRYLREEAREHFCAVFLDSKNGVLATRTIHVGTINASLVGPREVFREAIREGASSLIAVHNHPSGDPTPSPEDHAVTKRLAEVGKLLDLPLLDHVIVGHHRYVSLHELGAL